MTLRRQLRWRALAPALGLGIGIVEAGSDAVRAQGLAPVGAGEPIYEKRLDLRLNPRRSTEDEMRSPDAVQPSTEQEDELYERQHSLRPLSSDIDGRGEPLTRVIGGKKARPGAWRSTVHITYKKAFVDSVGRPYRGTSRCGASLIDRQWVLTAAHCLFDHRLGGLRELQWVTVFEGSIHSLTNSKRGRPIRVEEVHVHRQFGRVRRQLINDIALLKLEKAARVPPQKLTALAGRSTFLAEGNMATVVGWGRTHPTDPKSESPVLLQANVPIVDQPTCHRTYPDIGEVAFCAGYPEGKVDTCQGDSGGPLFVSGKHGQHLQAGITSFGWGCAQRDNYGVYTDIGRFEKWIRKQVPNASFALPPQARPGAPLDQIAGVVPSGPPAPHGQVAVDLAVRPCQKTEVKLTGKPFVSTNRIKAGSCIAVRVTSAVTGHLLVYQRNAKGETWPIFPNRISSGRKRQVGATPASVRAGEVITIPEDWDGFDFKVSPPFGRAEIIALVVPEGVNLKGVADRFVSGRSIPDMESKLDSIARQVNVVPRVRRAVGTRQFDVVE